MNQGLIDFGLGMLAGGLGLSACWGLFWLAVGTTGLARGTCGWRVVVNSLTVSVVPLLLIAWIVCGMAERMESVPRSAWG